MENKREKFRSKIHGVTLTNDGNGNNNYLSVPKRFYCHSMVMLVHRIYQVPL